MKNLKSLLKLKKEYTKKISEDGKEALKNEFEEFFEKNPKVLAVRWHQYTPHFNDGEPCVFNVYEARIEIEGETEKGGDYNDGFFSAWADETEKNNLQDVLKDLNKKLEEFADILEAVFGDGVEITISKKGKTIKVETDYYEHD